MAPLPVRQPEAAGLHLDAAGAHVHQQVQEAVQELHGEVVGARLAVGRRRPLAALAEQQQAAGLGGAEVEGDGAGPLGAPAGQRQVGGGRVERHGLRGRHVVAAESQVAVDAHLGVALLGEARQLQPELVVLVDHLEGGERR